MAFITTGLTKDGKTAHYHFAYADTLYGTIEPQRTNEVLAQCDADYAIMKDWFGGSIDPDLIPFTVHILDADGGANADKGLVQIFAGSNDAINVRMKLVIEVVEMFMAKQNIGWFQGETEGSKGEALSLFLGVEFLVAINYYNSDALPPGFSVTAKWLNDTRPNAVDVAPDNREPGPIVGCTTCFVWFLHHQLGYSIKEIINAGSDTLADVYKNLTGKTGAFTTFKNLVDTHYPPGPTYDPVGDSLFPVPDLAGFIPTPGVTAGYTQDTSIILTQPAPAEVRIHLKSSNSSLLTVPSTVLVSPGAIATNVPLTAKTIAVPFTTQPVTVHASYAGQSVDLHTMVVPPAIESLVLNPTTVQAADQPVSAVGIVTLDHPSVLGDVVVNLYSFSPGFAGVPSTLTIPQGKSSGEFPITVLPQSAPFKTAHVTIYAVYAGSSASAVLTVTSSFNVGILKALTLSQTSVVGGHSLSGTVTLEGAVPTDTTIGLAALQSGVKFPPNSPSPVAFVPASVVIKAGQTTAKFSITTKHLNAPPPSTTATIMAAAVVEKYQKLTVTS